MWRLNGTELNNKELRQYLLDNASGIYVLESPSGCGKTEFIGSLKYPEKYVFSSENIKKDITRG